MDIVKDFINVNRDSFKRAFKIFYDNPIFIIVNILFIFIYENIDYLFFGFGAISSNIMGLIIYLLKAIIISGYMYLLKNLIFYNRLNLSSLSYGAKKYFSNVYIIMVIYWIFNRFAVLLIPTNLIRITKIIILFIFNPIYEVIYQREEYGANALSYTLRFIGENWYLWIIPIIITSPNLGIYSVLKLNFNSIISTVIVGVILAFAILYRGIIFKELSTSTRRKRKYMGRF